MTKTTLALALLAALPAYAQQPASVQVTQAWARATPPGVTTGAVYMTLSSTAGDRVVSASSPAARTATLHEMSMAGGVMRMRPLPDGLALPPGRPVTLSPGGEHVMLEGLKGPLKAGSTVPVHLVFEKAPAMDVTATISPVDARGPAAPMPAMPGMTMGK